MVKFHLTRFLRTISKPEHNFPLMHHHLCFYEQIEKTFSFNKVL